MKSSSTIGMRAAPALLGGIAALVFAAPAAAVSLTSTNAPHPLPEPSVTVTPISIESWVAETWPGGSGSLVPMMAADLEARQTSGIDVPSSSPTGYVGKPLDALAFVRQAAENSRKELEAGRAALTRLAHPELKRIAQMLVEDHADANAKLEKIAETRGWPVPPARSDELPQGRTATADFDARWTAQMIVAHERAAALYRAQAQGGDDRDLRDFARETLPTIEHHLEELRSLQK